VSRIRSAIVDAWHEARVSWAWTWDEIGVFVLVGVFVALCKLEVI
jgi:hypothetical protein